MKENNLVHGRGTVVAQTQTGRLFIESPEHVYAVEENGPLHVRSGDDVEFEAVFGDQFARVIAVKGRRASL